MRRGGKEVFTQGARRNTGDRTELAEGSSSVSPEQRYTTKERKEGGSTPVIDMTSQAVSYPIQDVGAVTTPKVVLEMLSEEGKVKEMEEKIEEKVTDLGRFGEEKSVVNPGLVEGMQWKKDLCQGVKLIPEESLAPQSDLKMKEAGPSVDSPDLGPLALSFDDKKSWIVET